MIFVLGTGRSGTSAVSRVLQERLGVDMGDDLAPPGESVNPRGDYEDRQLREATIRAVRDGRLGPWRAALRRHAEGRPEPWGLKDPRFADVCTELLGLFPAADVIWCDRDLSDAAESAARVATGSYAHQLKVMVDRYISLERALRSREHLYIDMNVHRDPGWVVQRVRTLPTLKKNRGSFREDGTWVPCEGKTSLVSDSVDDGSVSGSGP